VVKRKCPARPFAPGFLLTLLLFFFGGTARADIALIKRLRDPHRAGDSFEADVGSANETSRGNLTSQFEYVHPWNSELNTSIAVPVTWVESNSGPKASGTPRLGGGTYNRITLNADSRLTGDAMTYLDLGFDVGLPFQTDAAEKSSLSASWLFGGELSGQLDFGDWAVAASLVDAEAFPKTVGNAAARQDYRDRTNFILGRASLLYFPNNTWALHANYFESPPFRTDIGTDTQNASYFLSSASSERSRSVGLGFETAVGTRTLFGIDEAYQLAGTDLTRHMHTWTGRMRWVF
jgi:hypothetical protein